MRYAHLTEDIAKDIAVFYGGRFQPMHKGHHKVYMNLVEQFGSSNVFIATTFQLFYSAQKIIDKALEYKSLTAVFDQNDNFQENSLI